MTGQWASGLRRPSLPSGTHDNRTRAAVTGARRTRRHLPETLPDSGRGNGRRGRGRCRRTGAASTAAAATPAADRRVAVLGGGGSGLSAAHELAERGYAVTVHEYYDHLGGKARSMDVPDTGTGGRRPLPGEHGFRFFPGFCRNPPDTMCRIPVPGNANGVHDNLRSGIEALFAHGSGRPDLHFPCDGSPPRPHPGTSPRPGAATRSCPSWISAAACRPTRPPTSPTASRSISPAATPAARTSGRRPRGGTSSGPAR